MAVMASANVASEVILIPDRTLVGVSIVNKTVGYIDLLSLELIWQNQICVRDDFLISRDDIVIDV